jgi:hypothetical protein
LSIIFGAASVKIIDSLCDGLVGGSSEGLHTFVDLKNKVTILFLGLVSSP